MTEENPALPPVKVAFIIDGEVVDVLHTDDRLGAMFLSNPVMVDVTDMFLNDPSIMMVGATYDGENFVLPPVPTPE